MEVEDAMIRGRRDDAVGLNETPPTPPYEGGEIEFVAVKQFDHTLGRRSIDVQKLG